MSYDTTGYTNNSKGLVGGCHVFLAFAMGSGRCRVFGLWAMGRRASTSQLEVKHVLPSEHEHHNIVIIMHSHAIKLIILSWASIQLSSVHSCFLGQWLSWDKYQLYISLILWLHELQSNFIDFWIPFDIRYHRDWVVPRSRPPWRVSVISKFGCRRSREELSFATVQWWLNF